jgi:hypothetical protein
MFFCVLMHIVKAGLKGSKPSSILRVLIMRAILNKLGKNAQQNITF